MQYRFRFIRWTNIKFTSNKIIGIHKGFINREKINIRTFIKFPLNGINANKSNEIRMKIKINEKNINKVIYFFGNTKEIYDGIEHYHDNLKELNEYNTELYINYKKQNIKNILSQKKKVFMKYY